MLADLLFLRHIMNYDEKMASLQARLNDRLKQLSGGNRSALTSMGADEATMTQATNTKDEWDLQEFSFCPECGKRIPADANFCPECGQALNDERGYAADDDGNSERNEGGEMILFTDTRELAVKYGVRRDEVLDLLNEFINANKALGVCCHLLDVADYQGYLGEGTWMDYSELLQNYIANKGVLPGPKLSLFIIGGNDVIPQPCEENPCFSPSPWGGDEYQERVYADFYYCFYGQIHLDYLDYNKARCNVSRLPLEMGKMKSSLEDDLGHYFYNSISAAKAGGIVIGRAVMTSNVDWIPASREMSRNLPTHSLEDEEDVVLDNMYISPSILADMDDDLRKDYYRSLSEADMLVFNLHGACQPAMSGFYSTDLAFSVDMIGQSRARIFNTVACWGGRYIKYSREQSMLLNALYNNKVLLYCGACVPAMGKCGNYQHDSTWRIQPAAYSETFMARFAEYQCIGTMTAGEAFLKAKCDYYNSSRMIEEDEITWATVLMFNLYGNPMLNTVPNVAAIRELQFEDGSKPMYRIPFRATRKEVVKKGEGGQMQRSGSILTQVRSAVDANLERLHKGIVENLYNRLGVEPRELFSVERFETADADGNAQKGYLYNYAKENNAMRSHIRVKVDAQGNFLDAIQTK